MDILFIIFVFLFATWMVIESYQTSKRIKYLQMRIDRLETEIGILTGYLAKNEMGRVLQTIEKPEISSQSSADNR